MRRLGLCPRFCQSLRLFDRSRPTTCLARCVTTSAPPGRGHSSQWILERLQRFCRRGRGGGTESVFQVRPPRANFHFGIDRFKCGIDPAIFRASSASRSCSASSSSGACSRSGCAVLHSSSVASSCSMVLPVSISATSPGASLFSFGSGVTSPYVTKEWERRDDRLSKFQSKHHAGDLQLRLDVEQASG